jgi:hypothetical protein
VFTPFTIYLFCTLFGGMKLNRGQFEQIAGGLSRQQGNVRLDNFQVINVIPHVAANGHKWRTPCLSRYGR